MTRNYRIRFCQNNYLAASGVVLTASGAKVGFPATNLFNPLRYMQWIAPGTFVITSANNQVPINDGADKSGSIATGTYTYSTLATAIQTALNAASSNWTCVYDFDGGTFKYTINRSGGTKTLRLSDQTNAVWDTIGYVGTIDAAAGVAADEVRCHTSETLTVDLLAPRPIDAFFLVAAADAIFPISSAATITLKADNLPSNWGSPAVSRSLSREDTGIFHYLDDLNDTTYRYAQFEFTDRKNPLGPESFAFSVAYLGDYYSPTDANIQIGLTRTINDASEIFTSDAGVEFFRLKPGYWSWDSLSIQLLHDDDRTQLESTLSTLGLTSPFFLSLDPLAQTSATAGEFTKYVRLTKAPILQSVRYKYWAGSISIKEVI